MLSHFGALIRSVALSIAFLSDHTVTLHLFSSSISGLVFFYTPSHSLYRLSSFSIIRFEMYIFGFLPHTNGNFEMRIWIKNGLACSTVSALHSTAMQWRDRKAQHSSSPILLSSKDGRLYELVATKLYERRLMVKHNGNRCSWVSPSSGTISILSCISSCIEFCTCSLIICAPFLSASRALIYAVMHSSIH